MNLKDFVKDSITQIIEGIVEADDIISEKKAHVNPTYRSTTGSAIPIAGNYHMLKFNVAVTETKEAKAGAKAGVKTGIVGVFLGASAEAGGAIGKGSENLSRIEFEVPVTYPLAEPEVEKR